MKTLAIVFAYERAAIFTRCIKSVLEQEQDNKGGILLPKGLVEIIDDSKTSAVEMALRGLGRGGWAIHIKSGGFSSSAVMALRRARFVNPDYLYLIESDYIFAPNAFLKIQDAFENTEHGRNCLGIVGYDHPNFYRPDFTGFTREYHDGPGAEDAVFSLCMRAQVGEDNVNRAVLHRPFKSGKHILERVSNTCFTCYLNWKKIQEVAAEFPELNDYLDQACAPRDNPNYPPSGEYKRKNVVDDGMLSHGINLVWNKWAIKHGIDRNEFSAWLNIKPSVAQNINGGGMHTNLPEGETDNGSPSWRE